MDGKCDKCGESIDHVEDYCYMKVNRRYYDFHRKCLEKMLNCDLEAWLVAVII